MHVDFLSEGRAFDSVEIVIMIYSFKMDEKRGCGTQTVERVRPAWLLATGPKYLNERRRQWPMKTLAAIELELFF